MPRVYFSLTLPVKIKKKANLYISSCGVLDVHSQGYTDKEARDNLIEAIRLFMISCFERGTLDEALKDCGFRAIKNPVKLVKDGRFITVPIPFNATGSCLSECRA